MLTFLKILGPGFLFSSPETEGYDPNLRQNEWLPQHGGGGGERGFPALPAARDSS